MSARRLHAAMLLKVASDAGDTTQQQIADRVGVHQSTIYRLLNDKVKPSTDTLLALSDAYSKPIEDFLAAGAAA